MFGLSMCSSNKLSKLFNRKKMNRWGNPSESDFTCFFKNKKYKLHSEIMSKCDKASGFISQKLENKYFEDSDKLKVDKLLGDNVLLWDYVHGIDNVSISIKAFETFLDFCYERKTFLVTEKNYRELLRISDVLMVCSIFLVFFARITCIIRFFSFLNTD